VLNYIWLFLIAVAIFVAVGRDVSEESSDRFRNNQPMALHVSAMKLAGPNHFTGTIFILKSEAARFYGVSEVKNVTGDTIPFVSDLLQSQTSPRAGTLTLALPSNTPQVMVDAAAANGDATKLIGQATLDTAIFANGGTIAFIPPSVHFRILAKVANEGILKVADIAVTLALGLIGVMALWLGIMKIAEAAGLVALLAKIVRPIMTRVFPDVPPDHPAMGAMVMNMTANFLGLSNAATPLGLKAMEELNTLNPVAGTATNAMCMFLTINTTALTLVPATVIAIRLTLGSTNPTDIIMPTFLATLVSLILGVFFTRFIQRFFPVKGEA
jgi:spore maturation protein SpmA